MRNDAGMRCEAAREALSARLDGERPPVLAQQVDAHLESCRRCRSWLIGAAVQTRRLATVEAGDGPDLVDENHGECRRGVRPGVSAGCAWLRSHYRRWGLIGVGVFQVAIAAAQISGIDFGMVSSHMHGAMSGEHLMHESTAWLLALGLAMVAAGSLARHRDWGGGDYRRLFGRAVRVTWSSTPSPATSQQRASPVTCPCCWGLRSRCWWRGNEWDRDRSGASGAADDADHPAWRAESPAARRRGHLWPINRSALDPAAAPTTGPS